MTRPRFTGRRWPTLAERLLLIAATAEPDDALAAWGEWRVNHDLDNLWGDVTHVLPRIARNLPAERIDPADAARLKGTYRRAWYENQKLFANASVVLRDLRLRGISVVVMKAGALIPAWYRDTGSRPTADIDILVAHPDIAGAVDVLDAHGYRPEVPLRTPAAETFRSVHGVGFSAGPLANIDLHTHALEECCYPCADDGLWSRARPLTISGVDCLRPSATDLLLTVCVHGVRGAPERVVHWVPDALTILGGDEPVDWDILVREARMRRLSLALGSALAYLQEQMSAPIPDWVAPRLLAQRHTLVERLDFAVQARAPGVGWMAARDVMRYARFSRGWSPVRRTVGWAGYLQGLWGLGSPAQLPGEIARRVRARRAMNATRTRREPR